MKPYRMNLTIGIFLAFLGALYIGLTVYKAPEREALKAESDMVTGFISDIEHYYSSTSIEDSNIEYYGYAYFVDSQGIVHPRESIGVVASTCALGDPVNIYIHPVTGNIYAESPKDRNTSLILALGVIGIGLALVVNEIAKKIYYKTHEIPWYPVEAALIALALLAAAVYTAAYNFRYVSPKVTDTTAAITEISETTPHSQFPTVAYVDYQLPDGTQMTHQIIGLNTDSAEIGQEIEIKVYNKTGEIWYSSDSRGVPLLISTVILLISFAVAVAVIVKKMSVRNSQKLIISDEMKKEV